MPYENYSVVDCDGHIVESVPEMAEFMSKRIQDHALKPSRNRQGVFPSLDGMHFALHDENAKTRKRVTASEYRPGSGEDWVAFLDRAKVERTVLFTSEGLSVGFIQIPNMRSRFAALTTITSTTVSPRSATGCGRWRSFLCRMCPPRWLSCAARCRIWACPARCCRPAACRCTWPMKTTGRFMKRPKNSTCRLPCMAGRIAKGPAWRRSPILPDLIYCTTPFP